MAGRTGYLPRGVPAFLGLLHPPDLDRAVAERRPGLISGYLRRVSVDQRKEAWRSKTAHRARTLGRTWQSITRDLAGRAPQRRKIEPGRWTITALLDSGQRAAVAEVTCPIPRAFSDDTPITIIVRIAEAFPSSGTIMRHVHSTCRGEHVVTDG